MRSYCSTLDGSRTVAVMFFVAGLHSGRVSGGVAFHSRLRAGRRYRACSGHRGVIGRVLDAQMVVGRDFAVFTPSSVRISPEDPVVVQNSPENTGSVRISPGNAAVSGIRPATPRCPNPARGSARPGGNPPKQKPSGGLGVLGGASRRAFLRRPPL